MDNFHWGKNTSDQKWVKISLYFVHRFDAETMFNYIYETEFQFILLQNGPNKPKLKFWYNANYTGC